MPFIEISTSPASVILPPFLSAAGLGGELIQPDSVILVPTRHVGEDHLVAILQPAQNLYRVHGTATQCYLHSRRRLSVALQLEHANRALLLAIGRASGKKHTRYTLQVNRPVHTQVRHRTRGQVAVQGHINGTSAVLYRRIDSRDLASDETVMRVYLCQLTELHILSLGLGNFELRLKAIRVGDFGDGRSCH